ncbi:MAG TPA: FAD-dependent oxidoreductase, partial [Trebonia sp.]|nr:FAD-dependent oxidoreductase [Trebonia sp.]
MAVTSRAQASQAQAPRAQAPRTPPADADVIVVGGGAVGTAVGWRAARAGHQVILVDPGGDDPLSDDKASLVAAGMLGPVSESVF